MKGIIMDANSQKKRRQSKNADNTNVELKQFYSSSQTYLKRLERHDEKSFVPYIELCKIKIPAGVSILDCGCGIGTSSYFLAKEDFKVTAIDLSPLFISEARKKYGNQLNLKFFVEDASRMSFQNNSFDAICSYDMLEHVTDIKSVLREMSRVIKVGGLLIIFMPNHLDPIQHLIASIRWKSKDKYKPWEARSRIESFWQFIRTAYLSIVKAIGINNKIYYLKPVLSNDENVCGKDFDETWLTNWFDIENILRGFDFFIEAITTSSVESKIMQWMKMLKLPKVLQSFYVKMRSPIIIVGRKYK